MQFYWSWRKLPEFDRRSRKEYRQALWDAGLKPFRHRQVWAAMLVTSLLILLGFETLFGFLLNQSSNEGNWQDALFWVGILPVIFVPRLLYRHFYLKFLSSYISQVSFDPAGSWWKAFARSMLVAFVPFTLIIIGMLSIDWAINYYDEDLDPRFAAIKAWPDPIPESENGFIAFTGLMSPIDTSIFEAGRSYVTAANEAILKQTTVPSQSYALRYVGYAAKPKAIDPSKPPGKNAKSATSNPSAVFCEARKQVCWDILRQERNEVDKWLAANNVLFARYESLKTYPRWQHARLVDHSAPILAYSPLIQAQSLLQASAMRAIESGQVEQGLELLGNDIIFVRRMLAGNDVLIGKMTASVMLTRDLSLLAQTLQEHPNAVKKYRGGIEKMVEPLTVRQISVVDALKSENKYMLSAYDDENAFNALLSSDIYSESEQKPISLVGKWMEHHFKKNASLNMLINHAEKLAEMVDIHDVNLTTPIASAKFDEFNKKFNENYWWYFNQGGKIMLLVGQPSYNEYANRFFDLNALNNLVRLQLVLVANGVAANDVSAFLLTSDRSQWNPETGKPFEWDAKQKQVYFVPATHWFKDQSQIGGVSGRVGLSVH